MASEPPTTVKSFLDLDVLSTIDVDLCYASPTRSQVSVALILPTRRCS